MFTPRQIYELIQTESFYDLKKAPISKYFVWGEVFVHREDSEVKLVTLEIIEAAIHLAQKLDRVRELFNAPVIVTSWWRDPASNREVGGVPNSRHIKGDAADITVKGLTPKQVQARLNQTWSGGLGFGKTFTHLDDRGYRARFNY